MLAPFIDDSGLLEAKVPTPSAELGPPPAPPLDLKALTFLTASTYTLKRRRTLAGSITLDPGLSRTSEHPSSEVHSAAVASAKCQMHAAEIRHEEGVANLARAQHAADIASEAEALLVAEPTRVEEERVAALPHAEACAQALEGMSTEVNVRKRARTAAASALSSAKEGAATVLEVLEETIETYHRAVRGYHVRQE